MRFLSSSSRAKVPRTSVADPVHLALVIIQLALVACTAGSRPKVDGTPLQLGSPIERTINQGETHFYDVVVPLGQMVNGVVDQRGVDVTVRVIDPSGETVSTVDSPNGAAGPEPWSLDGKTPGQWRLAVTITPFMGENRPGRYQMRIDEVLTMEEQAERLAQQKYRSPRLLSLWKERRTKGGAALQSFVKELEGHAPLVESVAGDAHDDLLITFVRRVPPDVNYVGLLGGPTMELGGVALARFENTDLRYLSLRAPKDARFTYQFLPLSAPSIAGASLKETAARFRFAEAD